jgi:uncharacterized protein YecT (DUF1311 family)
MLVLFRFSVVGLSLYLATVIGVNAASFDCSKASTETEITICNNPELSSLDELIASAFFAIEKDGRYAKNIHQYQRKWVNEDRQLDTYNFTEQLNFLEMASAANSCSTGERQFKDCQTKIMQEFENCQARENYTTLVMNRCGSAYLTVLQLIDSYETNIWREINSYDKETVSLFDIAYVKWNEFVGADCDWQYSEYRGGTIRGQIWLGCQIGHFEKRILKINGSNRFQGKDIEYLEN